MEASIPISRPGEPERLPEWHAAPHLLVIDDELTTLIMGETDHNILVIEAPPRHGKSELISKYLPTWYLGHWPTRRVILTSYADALASQFGRKCRDLLIERANWFDVPGVNPNVSAASDWEIAEHGGGMVTAGVGGPLTGRGANLLIIDDPIKNAEMAVSEAQREKQWEWFQSTAFSRLEPGGVCVLMMTRWHEEDLIGRVVQAAEANELDGMKVKRISFPAIAEADDVLGRKPGEALWPERWPLESLLQKKSLTEDYWWNALYQGRPTQYGRSEWPEDYFADPFWCDEHEWPDRFEFSAIALDPSKGANTRSDYAAIAFLGLARGLLWVDSLLGRWPADQLCDNLIGFCDTHPSDRVGIESNAFQDLLAPIIENKIRTRGGAPLPLALLNNNINKGLRIARLGPYLGRHAFRFRSNASTHLLVKQLKGFPQADHDDGPDALEMAHRLLNHLAQHE